MKQDKKILKIDRDGRMTSAPAPEKKKKDTDYSYISYLNIGFYLATPLLLGVLLGSFLDNWLKSEPLFIILFIVLGALSSFYNLIRLTRDASH